MGVIMLSEMLDAGSRAGCIKLAGRNDVQESGRAAAFSGGERPQSAPADSVAGPAAEAGPRPVQGRCGRFALANRRLVRPEPPSVQRCWLRRFCDYLTRLS
ncbi:MAG: hypothetical protein DWQ35_16025 [Planctomycetota bacterium]|nr:MAG: hypothetical protein DWQ35_16025 [Planctomycetota bacterium]REK18260.1 MAG: hypothetical protein DWQ42_20490 [Planctomycetota bacterium]REK49130.1 MAG: hypothetical protein DWQ46_01090 [Planctomycetota bacterium]